MDELLKRAGNTHLDLTISEPKSTIHISSAVNKIIGALTKARCLRVIRGYVPRKELPQCPEPSQMVLPNLRVLSVFGKPEGFVISMMSKAICPSLTSLRLINMPIPWNNVGLFPTSLTELEIVSIFDPLCRVENALSILARLPNLRFLIISRIGDKKPYRTQSLVQLPYLRELSLTDNCTTISALLGGIVCPASTSLSLQAHYYDQKSDDLRDMLKMILASGPVIQHLFLEIHEVETSMCLFTGLPDLYHTQTYHNFVFQSKNTIDIIHGILNQAPLSNLTSLRWNVRLYSRWTNSCHFPPDVVRFYDSFDKLEALEYLELSGRDSVAVLRHRLKSSSAPVHFPQLQTLKLRDLEEEWYYLARDLAHDFKHLGRCIRKGMLLFPKLCKIVFNKVAGCGEFERRILVDAICLGRSVSTTAVSIEVNKDETRYAYILPDEDAPSSPTHSGDNGTLTS
ncbi:hypothetical protein QCA50_004696 [Cerrena zonata]|uniref:Uncharacterized protein n=1 Tax=Cerrena zonata TaxID=2478898 RepID=A0AAW0GN23_9APHY